MNSLMIQYEEAKSGESEESYYDEEDDQNEEEAEQEGQDSDN